MVENPAYHDTDASFLAFQHHGVPFISVSAPSVVSGMSGESEKKLREIFEEAVKLAPSIIFIDEIDAVMPKRESAQREMEKRIVAQMLTCMDGTKSGSLSLLIASRPKLTRMTRFVLEQNWRKACFCDWGDQSAR